MRIRFQFRPIPFVAALLLVLLGIALGQWQTRRAEEKLQLAAQLSERGKAPAVQLGGALPEIDALEYRRVAARGHFVSEWPVYLDNRPQDGRPGFYVVMPFRIAGSPASVLVQRGWMPLNRNDRNKLMPFPTPTGEMEISGIARRHAGRLLQLGDAAPIKPGAIVQNLQIEAVGKAAGLKLLPIVIEQRTGSGDAPDGLIRDWPPPSNGVDMHRGYAFQWYALALMAFLFFVVTGCKRESN